MIKVIKRNGNEVEFKPEKLNSAIEKANMQVSRENRLTEEEIAELVDTVVGRIPEDTEISVEDIQDMVEEELYDNASFALTKAYSNYRFLKGKLRDNKFNDLEKNIMALFEQKETDASVENANKNAKLLSTQRDLAAGEISRHLVNKYILPREVQEAHQKGIIHVHDLDYRIAGITNCGLVNLEDIFTNGTVLNGTKIYSPKSFSTAATLASQIAMAVSASQYGGQSMTLTHLAPYVDISRRKIRHRLMDEFTEQNVEVSTKQLNEIVEKQVRQEVKDGIQTLNHQIVTMASANGQSPFITIFMYLNEAKNEQEKRDLALIIEEMLRQRIKGLPNEHGVLCSPVFPKLIYAIDSSNCDETKPYWYLTRLAAECTSKRMVPDYISEKKMFENKEEHCFPSMGCRSFLSPWYDGNGEFHAYGRFNLGVVTLNLAYVALEANGDMNKFWSLLDKYADLCFEAHMTFVKRLNKTKACVAPILWQHGAYARLNPNDTLDKVMYDGYATISLGYAGLYETVQALIHQSHTTDEGRELALQIMNKLNAYCDKWKKETRLAFSVYGTPMESGTYKFAKALQRDFDVMPEVNEHDYITNSYHVNVREEIDAFSKLSKESEFQSLSSGGSISYIEIPNMEKNIPALLEVIKFIYDNNMYAECNTRTDVCDTCGYHGEMEMIKDENGNYVWRCPNCGETNIDKLNIVRRVCGYLGRISNGVNLGRLGDIHDRVFHL